MTSTDMKPMTLEEFRALPEGPPYYEFEEGELVPVTSPTPEHQEQACLALRPLEPSIKRAI